MNNLFKSMTILLVFILIMSSIYIIFFNESEEPDNDNGNENGNGNNDDNNGNDDNNNHGNQEFVHNVFIEEATATWCINCPDVAEILHELYEDDNTNFYYVSMVEDENTKAHQRLYDDYNILGLPTVFIDGGYEVILGANNEKSVFKDMITSAKNRKVPELYMNITPKWNDNNKELTNTVTVENKDGTTYSGRLKVYIAEVNSRWSDYNGHPYNFAFLDYAINEDVEIKNEDIVTFSSEWKASSSGFSDVYPENLWIVAVLFSSKSNQAFSDPPDNEKSFNAYYADATVATRVAKGSLPPSIGISTPKYGVRYILNKERRKTFLGNTVLIGKTTIKTIVAAGSEVKKVDFTLKGGFRQITETITEEPFEWTWDTFALGRYTIVVKVYDQDGRTSTDRIDVIAFIL